MKIRFLKASHISNCCLQLEPETATILTRKMTLAEVEDGIEKGAMDKTEKEETVKKENDSEEQKSDSNGAPKKDEKADQDVVFVQDVGFTVKIVSPNLEPFDVQVGSPDVIENFFSKTYFDNNCNGTYL